MKYDFTSIMDRHGKDAIAVDGLGTGFAPAAPKEGFDAIPMWVADMNFPTVPTIQEAIIERTNHPAFGYFNPTDEYFDSIIRWQAKRNGVQGLTKECICTAPPTSALPPVWKTTAIKLCTAHWSRMKTACGGWTLRTWKST